MLEQQLDDLLSTLVRFRSLLPAVEATGDEIWLALKSGRKLLAAGNGGSAADALHLVEELVGRFEKDRLPLPAIALCADPTLLTCIGNDYGFEQVFARQVQALGNKGDVLVVFTTSGKSPNIVAALQTAAARGLRTIALLGKDGGAAKGLADHELIIPSQNTARIQEVHTFILHSWLARLEREY